MTARNSLRDWSRSCPPRTLTLTVTTAAAALTLTALTGPAHAAPALVPAVVPAATAAAPHGGGILGVLDADVESAVDVQL
ncbi:hypothetical protein [Actinomadura sp. NEAU-AAG7]|uniref:hypothetical protein n=1 Tax=Actinomadura sp. NEAU-AAG7 TaxID=2839640 RepID=UPI001BE43F42|nr:hypothetical protein [Actinomadura sp. NEAU-AAG7]MBT2207724.1 hypothetical protein [Actinomadura sp. NEAU-AAG7]